VVATDFYSGLSYLQLNEYLKASSSIQSSINYRERKMNGAHYLENFYMGIIEMEMGQLEKAISYFDAALNAYSHFSDAKFYKAQCLIKSKKIEFAKQLFKDALKDLEAGFTINEDNVIYETYPYQVSKAWLSAIVKSFDR
jgi:tetratricopeptide (TPR) repeat protein